MKLRHSPNVTSTLTPSAFIGARSIVRALSPAPAACQYRLLKPRMLWKVSARAIAVSDPTWGEATMSEATSAANARLETQLTEAFILAGQGPQGVEQAARVVVRASAGLLINHFKRHRLSEAEAEDLTQQVTIQVVNQLRTVRGRKVPWFWTVARNALVDKVRAKTAGKRGGKPADGQGEVHLDEDEFLDLLERDFGAEDLPGWVRDCVHRAMALMEAEHPRKAEALRLAYYDFTPEEIAVHYGATPRRVTKLQINAARQRKHQAFIDAREYFEHCRE